MLLPQDGSTPKAGQWSAIRAKIVDKTEKWHVCLIKVIVLPKVLVKNVGTSSKKAAENDI